MKSYIGLLVLLLDELIIGEIGCQEWLLLGWVGVFGDFGKCRSEFIFTIFPWDVSTVSGHLGSLVCEGHTPENITLDNIIKLIFSIAFNWLS